MVPFHGFRPMGFIFTAKIAGDAWRRSRDGQVGRAGAAGGGAPPPHMANAKAACSLAFAGPDEVAPKCVQGSTFG